MIVGLARQAQEGFAMDQVTKCPSCGRSTYGLIPSSVPMDSSPEPAIESVCPETDGDSCIRWQLKILKEINRQLREELDTVRPLLANLLVVAERAVKVLDDSTVSSNARRDLEQAILSFPVREPSAPTA